jgi:O-antigen biosynthesis protein WbqP
MSKALIKRLIDIAVGLAGLVVLAVVSPLIALAIRLESAGAAILVQTRVGAGERPFRFYKFRTMHRDTGDMPTHEAAPSVITRVGHFLRASKIDELPQLYNVVRGDMSLVGPRPCLPMQTALITARRDRSVTSWRPGLTGLAQVRGVDMSDPVRLAKIDAEYVQAQSIGLDLRILCATLFGRGLFHL